MYATSQIVQSNIILRYLNGETTVEEEIVLHQWRGESIENEETFEQVKNLWEGTNIETEHLITKFKTNEKWNELQQKVSPKKSKSVQLFVPRLAIAATFLLLFGMGFVFWQMFGRNAEIVVASSNEVQKVILPDNSIVWLNRNSKITYKKDFKQQRTLTLSGEGYFEVEANPQHPFEILTSKTTITVVGTKFNVSSYENTAKTEVKVISGKVRFANKSVKKEITLSAGEKAINTEHNEIITAPNVTDQNIISWKTGELNFSNNNITEVADIIEKAYNVKIELEIDLDKTKNCILSGKFSNKSLDEILDILQQVLGITFEKQSDIIIIRSTGC